MNAPRPGVVLLCGNCRHVWEPTAEDWATGHTTCPDCGGWTMTAALDEPKPTHTAAHTEDQLGCASRLPGARPGVMVELSLVIEDVRLDTACAHWFDAADHAITGTQVRELGDLRMPHLLEIDLVGTRISCGRLGSDQRLA